MVCEAAGVILAEVIAERKEPVPLSAVVVTMKMFAEVNLANANKKEHIRILNTKLDLAVPEIITPMELFIIKE